MRRGGGAAGSGAAGVSVRGGRAAAGAGPGSAAVAPALSARSHRRRQQPPPAPEVPRVSCAALAENGLFRGCVWLGVVSVCLLRSPLGSWGRGVAACSPPLVWLREALGLLLAGDRVFGLGVPSPAGGEVRGGFGVPATHCRP